MRALWLLLLLTACVPQTATIAPTPLMLYENGTWQNNAVTSNGTLGVASRSAPTGSEQATLLLPETPVHVSQQGNDLLVAYPYTLQRYINNLLVASTPFGGQLKTVKQWPQLLYILDNGIYTPTLGHSRPLDNPKDAVVINNITYWINNKGLYRQSELVYPSSEISALYGHTNFVYMQTPRGLVRYPDNLELLLPDQTTQVLCVGADLYVLSARGLSWLSGSGLLIKQVVGHFNQLLTNGHYLYTLSEAANPQRLVFDLNLEPKP